MKNSENHKNSFVRFKGFLKRIGRVVSLILCKVFKRASRRQISIACPNKIRKRIWSNLCATARFKITPHRAKVASEIIAAVKKGRDLANFQPKSNPIVRKKSRIKQAKLVFTVAERPSRVKEAIPSMLGKIKALFATIRQRHCSGFGTTRVNQPAVS